MPILTTGRTTLADGMAISDERPERSAVARGAL